MGKEFFVRFIFETGLRPLFGGEEQWGEEDIKTVEKIMGLGFVAILF